jgi:hypothetical protein
VTLRNAPGAGHSGWTEAIMRKLATALAVATAALSAHAAFACEGEKEHSAAADQSQVKPAVAVKTEKASKQQKKAKKVIERTEKAPVARADNG